MSGWSRKKKGSAGFDKTGTLVVLPIPRWKLILKPGSHWQRALATPVSSSLINPYQGNLS
jgi:hypothetical protein